MSLFFLEYDLRNQRNYQKLYDELNRVQAVRVLESLWAFKRINTNCENLRNHFAQFIDADDGLVVSQVTDWASRKVLTAPPHTN